MLRCALLLGVLAMLVAPVVVPSAGAATRLQITVQRSTLSVPFSSVWAAKDGLTVWAAGSSGKVVRTTDGGRTWRQVNASAVYSFAAITAVDATSAWGVGAGRGRGPGRRHLRDRRT